jgi:hypothetical protein
MTDPDHVRRYLMDPVFHARVIVTERILTRVMPDLYETADTALQICALQDEMLGHDPNQREPLIELCWYLAHQYERLLAVHASVQMDTPEDRSVHDQAVAGFRDAHVRGINKLVEISGPRP